MKILLDGDYITFALNDFEISAIQKHIDKTKINSNLERYKNKIKTKTDSKYKKLFLKKEYYDNFVTLGFKSDGDGNQADILSDIIYLHNHNKHNQNQDLDKLYNRLFEHIQAYKPHIMTGDKNLIHMFNEEYTIYD